MGFFNPSPAYTSFIEMIERAEDIYTRKIFNLFVDVFGEEDVFTALIEGEDGIKLLFDTFLEGHAEFIEKEKKMLFDKREKAMSELEKDEEIENEKKTQILMAKAKAQAEERARKGELKRTVDRMPLPPEGYTNSAGIRVEPEPEKVKEWDDLFGPFKKLFIKSKKGKL
jgi:hypothetical protein